MHWERIEPVAESFGDLDPMLDLREADLEEGQEWTGWHRIEKDLWPPADGYTPLTPDAAHGRSPTGSSRTPPRSYDRTRDMTFQADQLGNGAKELLDEVATGKITGEEEIWSHTDLWDFQANLDGARVMFEGLHPVVERKDRGPRRRARRASSRAVQALLDQYRDGDGFVLYTDLTPEQVKELAAAVDALGEPLSRLTATVLLGARRRDRDSISPAPPTGLSRRALLGAFGAGAAPVAGVGVAGAAVATTRDDEVPSATACATRSSASTRPASPRPRRTGCTSPPSTSPPTRRDDLIALLRPGPRGGRG